MVNENKLKLSKRYKIKITYFTTNFFIYLFFIILILKLNK